MMRAIASRVDPGVVLGLHYTWEGIQDREGSDSSEILQSSIKALAAGQSFQAHTHLPQTRTTTGTQEAWVIVEGSIHVLLYDLDDELCERVRLRTGDCFVLLRGGHTMEILEDTILYEFKNGPYLGQKADKRWIG